MPDFINSTYNSLLDSGWRMNEIDSMDMLGFLRIRAWSASRNKAKAKPKPGYIDQLWPSVSPK